VRWQAERRSPSAAAGSACARRRRAVGARKSFKVWVVAQKSSSLSLLLRRVEAWRAVCALFAEMGARWQRMPGGGGVAARGVVGDRAAPGQRPRAAAARRGVRHARGLGKVGSEARNACPKMSRHSPGKSLGDSVVCLGCSKANPPPAVSGHAGWGVGWQALATRRRGPHEASVGVPA